MPRKVEEWKQRVDDALVDDGRRAGGARKVVVDVLAEQSCCVSAQEIERELHERGTQVGLASVYRALELLHGKGLIQRVDLGDGGSRYEPILPDGDHHHHVVCDRCGDVTAFEDQSLERSIDRLGERLHRAVRAHDVVIHADCRRCQSV